MSPENLNAWGWRIPFLISIVLLGISVWIRLMLNESPAFRKMKEEGKHSTAPLTESFGEWKNLKIGKPIIMAGLLLACLTYFRCSRASPTTPTRRWRRPSRPRRWSWSPIRTNARFSSTRSAPATSPVPATSPRALLFVRETKDVGIYQHD